MTPIHLLAVLLGVAVCLQGAVNGRLALRVGLPLAIAINAAIVFVASLAWLFAAPGPERAAEAADRPPWFLYSGGVFGLVIVVSAAIAYPRLGAGTTTVLAIASQLATALLLDRFGVAGQAVPWSSARILGVLLVGIGTWLVILPPRGGA